MCHSLVKVAGEKSLAAVRRDKTIHYRRAEWFGTAVADFEACLKETYKALKTVEDRTIVRSSGQHIRYLKKREPQMGGIAIHITADTPGEEASVVPKVSKGTSEADVGTAVAPPDAEFMDGDAFLYANGDHVCICATSMRDGPIAQFLYDIFVKAGLEEAKTQFELIKVANTKSLKVLHKEGVKEIELRASLYEATAKYEKRKWGTAGALRAVGRHFRALVATEKAPVDDSLRVMVTIRTDRRVKKHVGLSEKRIEKLAVDVLKNGQSTDDFVIVTNAGNRIGADDISVKEVVKIETHGKSVRRDKAWESLERFYTRIQKAGFLET